MARAQNIVATNNTKTDAGVQLPTCVTTSNFAAAGAGAGAGAGAATSMETDND